MPRFVLRSPMTRVIGAAAFQRKVRHLGWRSKGSSGATRFGRGAHAHDARHWRCDLPKGSCVIWGWRSKGRLGRHPLRRHDRRPLDAGRSGRHERSPGRVADAHDARHLRASLPKEGASSWGGLPKEGSGATRLRRGARAHDARHWPSGLPKEGASSRCGLPKEGASSRRVPALPMRTSSTAIVGSQTKESRP